MLTNRFYRATILSSPLLSEIVVVTYCVPATSTPSAAQEIFLHDSVRTLEKLNQFVFIHNKQLHQKSQF